jgi:hypothetical protein
MTSVDAATIGKCNTEAEHETTFNMAYIDGKHIAYFSAGRLPILAPGTDPSLPTLGTGRSSNSPDRRNSSLPQEGRVKREAPARRGFPALACWQRS